MAATGTLRRSWAAAHQVYVVAVPEPRDGARVAREDDEQCAEQRAARLGRGAERKIRRVRALDDDRRRRKHALPKRHAVRGAAAVGTCARGLHVHAPALRSPTHARGQWARHAVLLERRRALWRQARRERHVIVRHVEAPAQRRRALAAFIKALRSSSVRDVDALHAARCRGSPSTRPLEKVGWGGGWHGFRQPRVLAEGLQLQRRKGT